MAYIQHSRVLCCMVLVVCICKCRREDISAWICSYKKKRDQPEWGFLAAEVINKWLIKRWLTLLELAACLVCCCCEVPVRVLKNLPGNISIEKLLLEGLELQLCCNTGKSELYFEVVGRNLSGYWKTDMKLVRTVISITCSNTVSLAQKCLE